MPWIVVHTVSAMVIARRQALSFLELSFDSLKDAHAQAKAAPGNAAARTRFEKLRDKLRALVTADREFSACVGAAIEEVIATLGPP